MSLDQLSMQAEIIKDIQKFLLIEKEWNSALDQSGQASLSLTHDWLRCWWAAFGGDARLWVLVIRDNGFIKVAAPLMATKRRFRGLSAHALSLTVNGHSPEGGVILAEPSADSWKIFLEYLRRARNEWDVLELTKLRADSEATRCLELALNGTKTHTIKSESLASPFVDMSVDWGSYYANRSKKFRKVMRNKLNRVDRDGSITIERINDLNSLRSVMGEIMEVSSKSWKAREGRSIPDDPRVAAFYKEITDIFGSKGAVEVWLMRRAGEAIAFEYHIRYQGIAHPIRADFDDTWHELSPGSVLEYQIIRALFEDSEIRGYNSCGHTYEYLMNWATDVITHVDFQIFNSGTLSRNLYLLETKVIPMVREAKRMLRPKRVEAKV
ncbi:MAG: hypothetical protein Kow0099_26800 [Candidatus Abyssubacteria bacterium]